MNEFSFDVFEYTKDELIELVFQMFEKSEFLQHFRIKPEIFKEYLGAVADNYHNNPYHNFYHAVDVLQFVYKLHHDRYLEKHLNLKERFCLFLAALSHDIAHPGKNAAYQKKVLTEIYKRFGEKSTLEKYHAEVALSLLNDDAFQILQKIQDENAASFIQDCILATDMQLHGSILKKIEEKALTGSKKYAILTIKCADLGQLIRPLHVSENWVKRLHKEQYLQREAEIEKEIGRGENEDEFLLSQKREQEGFVKKFAYPLYYQLSNAYPELKGIENRLHSPFTGT